MKIVSNDTHDTGGNNMMTELIVEGGGKLASITITAECIVGNEIPYYLRTDDTDVHDQSLFIISEYDQLDSIPDEIRNEVIHHYKGHLERFNIDYNLLELSEDRFAGRTHYGDDVDNMPDQPVVIADILEAYWQINADVLTDRFVLNLRIEIAKQRVKAAMEAKLHELLEYVEETIISADEIEHGEHNVNELLECIQQLY